MPDIEWVTGRVFVATDETNARLWISSDVGQPPQAVTLESARPCRLRILRSLHRLNDHEVSVLDLCLNDGTPQIGSFGRALAIDIGSRRVRVLADLGAMVPSELTWNDRLRMGYVEQDSRICGAIRPVSSRGQVDTVLQLTDLGATWDLVQGSQLLPGGVGCAGHGRAAAPALSPNGDRLAFLASPTSAGVQGQARLAEPWYLYVTETRSFLPRRVSKGIYDARNLRWSPAGRWLAVDGRIRNSEGLWLLDLERPSWTLALPGPVADFTWSPDGSGLYVRTEASPDGLLVQVASPGVVDEDGAT